jgi:hypothetical protein
MTQVLFHDTCAAQAGKELQEGGAPHFQQKAASGVFSELQR